MAVGTTSGLLDIYWVTGPLLGYLLLEYRLHSVFGMSSLGNSQDYSLSRAVVPSIICNLLDNN